MAAKRTKSSCAQWEQAYNHYVELNLRLHAGEDFDQVESMGRSLAEQGDLLMSMPAPHLPAVLMKLFVLWGDTELHGLDANSREKRVIIEDLQNLIDEAAGLVVMSSNYQSVRTFDLWGAPPPPVA